MSKFKFSLRFLMLLCIFSAITVWWISAPGATAKLFVQRIRDEEYEHAADMFVVNGTAAMLTDLESSKVEEVTAWIPTVPFAQRLTAALNGRQRIELTVGFVKDGEEISGLYPLEASFRGIHVLAASLDHNFKTSNTIMEDR